MVAMERGSRCVVAMGRGKVCVVAMGRSSRVCGS